MRKRVMIASSVIMLAFIIALTGCDNSHAQRDTSYLRERDRDSGESTIAYNDTTATDSLFDSDTRKTDDWGSDNWDSDNRNTTRQTVDNRDSDDRDSWGSDNRNTARQTVDSRDSESRSRQSDDSSGSDKLDESGRWTLIDENPTVKTYVDFSSVERDREKDVAIILTMYAFSGTQKHEGVSFQSGIVRVEYDCKNPRMRALSSKVYSGRMGAGNVVYSDTEPEGWSNIPRQRREFKAHSDLRDRICK